MKLVGLRTSTWLRMSFSLGVALMLLGFVFARTSAMPLEDQGVKAPGAALHEMPFSGGGAGGDSPDDADLLVATFFLPVVFSPAPQTLGLSVRQPFHSMVHQLRDRLMHAPPVWL